MLMGTVLTFPGLKSSWLIECSCSLAISSEYTGKLVVVGFGWNRGKEQTIKIDASQVSGCPSSSGICTGNIMTTTEY